MVLAVGMLTSPAVEAKKPIVAVFDIEFQRVRLKRDAAEVLNNYLVDKVAASGKYQVVPRDQLKKRLVAQKKRSYKQCYQQSCQIEIGKELAAQKSLATRVMKIGRQCVVTATLYDLKKATTERGATAKGKCSEGGIMASLDKVVGKVTGVKASAPTPAPPPAAVMPGKAGIKWVTILGGSYMMGSNSGDKDEKPLHQVKVSTFRMSETEATVTQYRACVDAGKCSSRHLEGYESPAKKYTQSKYCNWSHSGRGTHPMNCIDWNQARAFCKWAGGRLPSEAEWEYAARSGGRSWKYPWGNEAATCSRAVMSQGGYGCGKDRTWPVCSKTAGNTTQGLCDMAGNVWEWTEDCWHGSYSGSPSGGRAWTQNCSDASRVGRGGGLYGTGGLLRAAYRNKIPPGNRGGLLGVRCVR